MPRGLRILLGSAVGLGFVLAALWIALSAFARSLPEGRCRRHERFSAAVWRDTAQAYGELAPRGCMVDDLLARRDLHGLSRTQVVALLGEPPPTGYFREYDLVYWLGPERGLFSIDSEWLVFRLNATGRVADYRLVTD
ncbi:hypothetical protein [Longimicrobium sp.]|uniref:hypothetical protein n=1 Tax=Longimicrobium sp. TaxID=2029185 RepID=UPI002C358C13|nr:hypothetical protein [Longimicrobium sp.]HSU13719.1 hypothetical protein [Longimicrobium sp.]